MPFFQLTNFAFQKRAAENKINGKRKYYTHNYTKERENDPLKVTHGDISIFPQNILEKGGQEVRIKNIFFIIMMSTLV